MVLGSKKKTTKKIKKNKNTCSSVGFAANKNNFFYTYLFRSHLSSAVVDLKRDFGLVMVYNSNVDQAGHERGPDSDEVKEEIKK